MRLPRFASGDGADLFRIACEQDLEGIVSKRLDAPYRGGRGLSWLKTKCVLNGEFVIIGYQPGSALAARPLTRCTSPPSNGTC